MGREFLAMFHGGYGDEVIMHKSGVLFLLGMIFLSLSVISMIIFACGADNSHEYRRKRNRGLTGLGGDDGGGGSNDGGGGGGGGWLDHPLVKEMMRHEYMELTLNSCKQIDQHSICMYECSNCIYYWIYSAEFL